jgi:hypothetical protein
MHEAVTGGHATFGAISCLGAFKAGLRQLECLESGLVMEDGISV